MMEIYAKMLSYFHVAKIVRIILIKVSFQISECFSKWFHNEKKEKYENFIYSFKKCFTGNAVQNSFTHKHNIVLWKGILFFWIDFTNVLSILQKLKIANNSIMILSYSNDKNIYITKNIISID